MQIVALLPSEALAELMRIMCDVHTVYAAGGPAELYRIAATSEMDVAIVDPSDPSIVEAIEASVSAFPELPFVVYTSVSAKSMASVLRLARLGVGHMVLFGIDDDAASFLDLVERIPATPLVGSMLAALTDSLGKLPISVQRSVQQLFRTPSAIRTGSELAQASGMTRRTLYRHMSNAGLHARVLIDSARLLRAYALLRRPGSRLNATSARLGFANPDTLSVLLRHSTGLSVRSIHRGLPPEAFIRILVDNVLRHAEEPTVISATSPVAPSSEQHAKGSRSRALTPR